MVYYWLNMQSIMPAGFIRYFTRNAMMVWKLHSLTSMLLMHIILPAHEPAVCTASMAVTGTPTRSAATCQHNRNDRSTLAVVHDCMKSKCESVSMTQQYAKQNISRVSNQLFFILTFFYQDDTPPDGNNILIDCLID